MGRETPNPWHAEVIGSMLRPPALKEAMERREAGTISEEELEAVQEAAGIRAIALQEEAGVDVVTDGEVRRARWFDPLTESLGGYSLQAPAPVPFQRGGAPSLEELRLPAVHERVSLRQNLSLREYEFVSKHATKAVKTTMPGLTYASVLWVPGVSEAAYPDRDEYMQDVLNLYREMVQQLIDSGARYIQLDSPRYTHLVSEEGRENLRRVGLDPSTWLQQMIDYDNKLVDSFPDVTWGLHLCRGNHKSMWSVEGGYDDIAEQLFTAIHVDRLMLEYDSPRSGTFAPLRFVPDDKVVVLGLITTKEPEVEPADLLKSRIEEAVRFIPIERLALSPQCGFASTLPGNMVTEDIQRAKLERLSAVARDMWS